MIARRTEPTTRSRFSGFYTLSSGRLVYATHSAVLIGLRYNRPARDHGPNADRIQQALLEGSRPLWTAQLLVASLCEPGRRP